MGGKKNARHGKERVEKEDTGRYLYGIGAAGASGSGPHQRKPSPGTRSYCIAFDFCPADGDSIFLSEKTLADVRKDELHTGTVLACRPANSFKSSLLWAGR